MPRSRPDHGGPGEWAGAPVLVTGASGFIGGRLAARLHALGATVHALRSPRLRSQEAWPPYHWVEADLLDPDGMASLVRQTRPAVVFHLGGVVNLERRDDVARSCLAVNIQGTCNVLAALSGLPETRLVYSSTTEVYGDGPVPFREDQLPRPPSAYAISKLAGEQLCQLAWRREGRWAAVVRVAASFGPGQAAHRLIPALIRAGLLQQPLEVGDGDQERDWLYVEDAVEGLLSVARCEPAAGEVVNLGSRTRVSHRGLAERIGALLGAPVPVRFTERRRAGEARVWATDAERARQWCHWSPRHDLEQGLRDTIRWQQDQLSQRTAA